MNPKKNKNKNRRKSRTPKKRVTRLHSLGDTETENDSQEEVPESAESEGEEEPQSDPILPDGEWFMPDLCSTTLTEVIRKGTPYEGDNTGRIVTQFPKLKEYTKSNFYLVSPFTGKMTCTTWIIANV